MPPSPEDPRENLLGDEFSAQASLLVWLHNYHEHGGESDATAKQRISLLASELAPNPLPPVEQKLFIWKDSDVRVLVGHTYDEMEWRPKDGTNASVWVKSIFVRYPRLEGEQFANHVDETGALVPNDILIQVNEDRYLLNDRGLTPYVDGESLDFDKEELAKPRHPAGEKPNVLKVVGDHNWSVAPLSAVDLQKLLLEECVYTQREENS